MSAYFSRTCTCLLVVLLVAPSFALARQERLAGLSWRTLVLRATRSSAELNLTLEQHKVLKDMEDAHLAALSALRRSFPPDTDPDEMARQRQQLIEAQRIEAEQLLRATLSPEELAALIRLSNQLRVRSRVNAPAHEGRFPLSFAELHEALKLPTDQRRELEELDREWRKKLDEVGDEWAEAEDKLAEDYERQLIRVLQGAQRTDYQHLVGEPAEIVKDFTAVGRRRAGRGAPAAGIPIAGGMFQQLSAHDLETLVKMLVFRPELEPDLSLVPRQQERFAEIYDGLKEGIPPNENLDRLFSLLRFPPERARSIYEMQGLGGRVQREPIDLDQVLQRIHSASEEALEVLLRHQRRRLEQVALQYAVGFSRVKFPLRFSWVREQLNVDPQQHLRLDEILEEHDQRLEELHEEYRQREAQTRREAELALLAVLDDDQQRQLRQYVGSPDWALTEIEDK